MKRFNMVLCSVLCHLIAGSAQAGGFCLPLTSRYLDVTSHSTALPVEFGTRTGLFKGSYIGDEVIATNTYRKYQFVGVLTGDDRILDILVPKDGEAKQNDKTYEYMARVRESPTRSPTAVSDAVLLIAHGGQYDIPNRPSDFFPDDSLKDEPPHAVAFVFLKQYKYYAFGGAIYAMRLDHETRWFRDSVVYGDLDWVKRSQWTKLKRGAVCCLTGSVDIVSLPFRFLYRLVLLPFVPTD